MCTATSWNTSPEEFVATFRNFDVSDLPRYSRLMIRPTESQVFCTSSRHIELKTFGILDPTPERQKRRIVNAKRENLGRSPLWRSMMESQRCVVFVTAFYECRRDESMHVYRIGEARGDQMGPSAMAGLHNESGVVIVTRPAENVMAGIHDRMPAVLQPDWLDEWLDGSPADARRLIDRPAPLLHAIEIAADAFKRDSNDPVLLKEDRQRPPQQQLLF